MDKSTSDLPVIEENPENNYSTMKGSKVTTPKEVIEEKISVVVSQEDRYSDEEYEVIDEAEELQQQAQDQQQVRETYRSSNKNHIRDQIQAMDDGTSFGSDLQMTKPAVIDN